MMQTSPMALAGVMTVAGDLALAGREASSASRTSLSALLHTLRPLLPSLCFLPKSRCGRPRRLKGYFLSCFSLFVRYMLLL